MPDISPRSLWQFHRLDRQTYRWYVGRGLTRLFGVLLMSAALSMHLTPTGEWPRIIATLIVSVVVSLLLRYHLRHTTLRVATPRLAERITWVAALFGVLGVQAINLLTKDATAPQAMVLIAPLVAQAMLTAALLGPSVGIIGLTMTMVLLTMFGAVPLEVITAAWLAGAVGSHAVSQLKKRNDLLRALVVQVCTNSLLAVGASVSYSRGFMPTMESVAWASLAAVVGLSIFWLAVTVFERIYGIVSDWTLLELCSPDNAVLSELNVKAPGTYAHSIGVGNLAEAAAREIGANPVLCRTMAYYHDIGKAARPTYFIENQLGENVHNDMPASLSAKVVRAHVADGIETAKRARLPSVVIDGIAQHHGTSLISFFYHRAQSEASEQQVDEAKFRYDGPKPQTVEAGLLHLADMVEAASRTVSKREDIDSLVRQLFETTIADGQLDECAMTFRDVEAVRESFVKSLGATRHERIAYPHQTEDGTTEATGDRDEERIARAIEA